MNRSEMYKVVRANYVPGNAKFLDTNGKFHNFGSAHSGEGVFQFSENREDETPMPRHHLCDIGASRMRRGGVVVATSFSPVMRWSR